jgi:hypothetical protein
MPQARKDLKAEQEVFQKQIEELTGPGESNARWPPSDEK